MHLLKPQFHEHFSYFNPNTKEIYIFQNLFNSVIEQYPPNAQMEGLIYNVVSAKRQISREGPKRIPQMPSE